MVAGSPEWSSNGGKGDQALTTHLVVMVVLQVKAGNYGGGAPMFQDLEWVKMVK